jgi:hypothetical protein
MPNPDDGLHTLQAIAVVVLAVLGIWRPVIVPWLRKQLHGDE